jgi:hypothetical protein
MPLLDHFRAPLAPRRHWESFHVNWAGAIADVLNEKLLPPGYFAEEHEQLGPRVEIDMATFAEPAAGSGRPNGAVSAPPVWAPPRADGIAAFPDTFEVLVFEAEGGASRRCDRAGRQAGSGVHRRAFVVKCGSYLARGIGLIVIDVVTTQQTSLHNELVAVLACRPRRTCRMMPSFTPSPIGRSCDGVPNRWLACRAAGWAASVLPLSLNAELCLPVDLEATLRACRRRRLPW